MKPSKHTLGTIKRLKAVSLERLTPTLYPCFEKTNEATCVKSTSQWPRVFELNGELILIVKFI